MKDIYKIIFLCLLTSVLRPPVSFSQTAPGIEWQNTIGGSGRDFVFSIYQTSDGGYIIGGSSESGISGDKTEDSNGDFDIWIVKIDSSGIIQWQNTIGGSNTEDLRSIQQTSDGGYILGGSSNSNISGDKTEDSWNNHSDYWLVKTDPSGNIQWQNTIGGDLDEGLYCIQQTTDGGYILGGNSASDISGDKTENSNGDYDCWIVKTDSLGNIQWQNSIGGSSGDECSSIQQTTDGGYILGCTSNSDFSGDKTENSIGGYDYWIVKTDSSGNLQWENTIGGDDFDLFFSIQQTTDGGYILGGYSPSNISGDKTENSIGGYDYWVVKTDISGNIQWQNTIGGSGYDYLNSIKQTTDGGYILMGHSYSNISGDKNENCIGVIDFWVVKINGSGTIEWQNTIGGDNGDGCYTIQQTSDDGYIVAGSSRSNISGDKTEDCLGQEDYWIVKLFPDTITGITQLPNYPITISVFPNPLTTQSKLTFKNPGKEKFLFTLYDITGRITETVSTTNDEIILIKGTKTPDSYREGVYLFNLMNEKTGERWNGKIVISD